MATTYPKRQLAAAIATAAGGAPAPIAGAAEAEVKAIARQETVRLSPAVRGQQHSPRGPPADPLVTYPSLKPEFGIPYTQDHLRRLWKKGRFPMPLQISAHRVAWRRSALVEWLDTLRPVAGDGDA
jgi:hypothetical protein